jgi:thiol-disulfide isomerase/thioredoxin
MISKRVSACGNWLVTIREMNYIAGHLNKDTSMKKVGLISLAALALNTVFAVSADELKEDLMFQDDAIYASWIGKPAQVKFTAVDGREVDLQKMRGKVVLLDFWATWCGPCRREIPAVRSTFQKYHAKGFEIIGVSFDDDKEALVKLVQQEHMVWPQYFEGTNNRIGDQFGIKHYPSMWMVDKQGVIRYISAGEKMEEKLTTLLAETYTNSATAGSTIPSGKLDAALADLKLKEIVWAQYPTGTIQTSQGEYPMGPGKNATLKTTEGDLWVHCVSVTTNAMFLSMKGRATTFKLALP